MARKIGAFCVPFSICFSSAPKITLAKPFLCATRTTFTATNARYRLHTMPGLALLAGRQPAVAGVLHHARGHLLHVPATPATCSSLAVQPRRGTYRARILHSSAAATEVLTTPAVGGLAATTEEEDNCDPAAAPHWLSRSTLLLDETGIASLGRTRVLIVGLGGVGGFAAEFLAR